MNLTAYARRGWLGRSSIAGRHASDTPVPLLASSQAATSSTAPPLTWRRHFANHANHKASFHPKMRVKCRAIVPIAPSMAEAIGTIALQDRGLGAMEGECSALAKQLGQLLYKIGPGSNGR